AGAPARRALPWRAAASPTSVARLRSVEIRRLCFRSPVPSVCLVYARGMHSAHDLLTRWPALDVAAKRARLQDTFRLSPGPLRDAVSAAANEAERAAAGLWRRDPAVWS